MIVIVNSSTAAMNGPEVTPIVPTGRSCQTCRPNVASGFAYSSAPSRIIETAPPPHSSAGWKQSTTLPGSVAASDTSVFATPSRIDVCASWPHACILPAVCER